MQELILVNNVAGSGKTTSVTQTALNLGKELTRDLLMHPSGPMSIAVCTFYGSTSRLTEQSFLDRCPLMLTAKIEHITIDSLFCKVFGQDAYDWKSDPDLTKDDWWELFKNERKANVLRDGLPSAQLLNGIKRKISISEIEYVAIVVDEAQDLTMRHLIFLVMLLLKGWIRKLCLHGDMKQTLRPEYVAVTSSTSLLWPHRVDPKELLETVGNAMGLDPSAAGEVCINEQPAIESSHRLSPAYSESLGEHTQALYGVQISEIFQSSGAQDYRLIGVAESKPCHGFRNIIPDRIPAEKIFEAGIWHANYLQVNLKNPLREQLAEIENKAGALLGLYHERAHDILEGVLSVNPLHHERLKDWNSDHRKKTPGTIEGELIKKLRSGGLSRGTQFLEILRAYLSIIMRENQNQNLKRKIVSSKIHTNFSRWICCLERLSIEGLEKRMRGSGLAGTSDILAFLKMLLPSARYHHLLGGLDERFVLCWTLDKAKGQTFASVLVFREELAKVRNLLLSDGSLKKNQINAIWRNALYVAFSRSNETFFINLKE